MGLALLRIIQDGVGGDMAEVGVWRGDCAEFIHKFAPERNFYLFDTFEGFPDQEEPADNLYKNEFLDTSEEMVRLHFAENPSVIVKAGNFPDTARDLEGNRFTFVSIDCDLYKPILDSWNFFYPRMSKGGYIFVHDHNGLDGYNQGALRATKEFLSDKPELIVDIPDQWGSILIRKI